MLLLMQYIREPRPQPVALTWLALACLAGFSPLPSPAATVKSTITISTNYYFITGNSESALHQSLQQARPWRDQAGHDARTVWNASYKFGYQQTEAGFAATSFELQAKIAVTLPFWRMPADAPQDLRQRWVEYLRALYTHEQGHYDVVRQAMTDLEQHFQALGAYRTVAELRRAISQVGTNTLSRARREELNYDTRTQHGATQGAVFQLRRPSPPASGGPAVAAPAK
jgi:predicted secreted Zn-dependent protease